MATLIQQASEPSFDWLPLDILIAILKNFSLKPRLWCTSLVSKRWRVASLCTIETVGDDDYHDGIKPDLAAVVVPRLRSLRCSIAYRETSFDARKLTSLNSLSLQKSFNLREIHLPDSITSVAVSGGPHGWPVCLTAHFTSITSLALPNCDLNASICASFTAIYFPNLRTLTFSSQLFLSFAIAHASQLTNLSVTQRWVPCLLGALKLPELLDLSICRTSEPIFRALLDSAPKLRALHYCADDAESLAEVASRMQSILVSLTLNFRPKPDLTAFLLGCTKLRSYHLVGDLSDSLKFGVPPALKCNLHLEMKLYTFHKAFCTNWSSFAYLKTLDISLEPRDSFSFDIAHGATLKQLQRVSIKSAETSLVVRTAWLILRASPVLRVLKFGSMAESRMVPTRLGLVQVIRFLLEADARSLPLLQLEYGGLPYPVYLFLCAQRRMHWTKLSCSGNRAPAAIPELTVALLAEAEEGGGSIDAPGPWSKPESS